MIAVECPWALKEWAVTIAALDRGEQVLLLRKGGIHEQAFNVEHTEFLLYPTYEHQRADLLKPQYRQVLQEVLAQWDAQAGIVPLTHWCRVTEVIEIVDPTLLEALSPLYLWTTDYAERRLHWRPRRPLEVLLVRAYRLPEPYPQRIEPYFAGCKSWIELPQPVPVGDAAPVLSEAEYAARVEQVKAALQGRR